MLSSILLSDGSNLGQSGLVQLREKRMRSLIRPGKIGSLHIDCSFKFSSQYFNSVGFSNYISLFSL